MKDLFKRIRIDVILSSVICIVFGAILIIWPMEVTSIVCRLLAIALILVGAINLVSLLFDGDKNYFRIAGGLILFLVGVWILLKPESIMVLVPIVIGVVLLIHALENFKQAFWSKKNGYSSWWAILLMAIVNAVLGVLCICDSFGVVAVGMTIIGISMIYDGLTDLWIFSRVRKTVKEMANAKPFIDVEYKDVEK